MLDTIIPSWALFTQLVFIKCISITTGGRLKLRVDLVYPLGFAACGRCGTLLCTPSKKGSLQTVEVAGLL